MTAIKPFKGRVWDTLCEGLEVRWGRYLVVATATNERWTCHLMKSVVCVMCRACFELVKKATLVNWIIPPSTEGREEPLITPLITPRIGFDPVVSDARVVQGEEGVCQRFWGGHG